jgi:hypothetical protein
MANMADSIRQAKMMTGSTGAGAGKAVSDEDVDRLRKMMAERNMANTESQNATTDMDAEKAGMIKKLMMMMQGMKESGRGMSDANRQRLDELRGRKVMSDSDISSILGESGKTISDADRRRVMGMKGMKGGGMVKKYKGGGSVKKYKGGGCVMPGRGKSRAMNK